MTRRPCSAISHSSNWPSGAGTRAKRRTPSASLPGAGVAWLDVSAAPRGHPSKALLASFTLVPQQDVAPARAARARQPALRGGEPPIGRLEVLVDVRAGI